MVEPRHRAIVDVEGEALLDQATQRESDGGLDRAAMAGGDHVLAGMRCREALDRVPGAVVEIHETFAAGCGLVDVGKPAVAGRAARDERGAVHALPLPKMLLGEGRFLR